LQDLGIETSGKIILYTPTYNTGLCPWGNAYEEFEKLCIFCNKNNLTLILRMHPYAKIDRDRVRKIIDIYDNVFWLDMPEELDTMKLLAVADILINVRSSTSNEYFLTKRPIIYLEGDGEFFEKTTGKTKIPNEFRAGEVVSNDKELYNSLKTILEYGNKYIEKQEKYLKIIHGNVNGKASENVVKIIENISKK
jgi:CDP-glycerol glycerophosphotransferase (TagB/SpsB family)